MLVNEIPCHLLGHFEDTVYLVYLFSTAAWEVTFFIYLFNPFVSSVFN